MESATSCFFSEIKLGVKNHMNSVNDPLRWPLPEMGEVAALQKDLKQSGFAIKVPPCRKKKCWNEDTTPKSTLQNPWAFYPSFLLGDVFFKYERNICSQA